MVNVSEDDFCECMALRTFIFYSKWEDAIALTESYKNSNVRLDTILK